MGQQNPHIRSIEVIFFSKLATLQLFVFEMCIKCQLTFTVLVKFTKCNRFEMEIYVVFKQNKYVSNNRIFF